MRGIVFQILVVLGLFVIIRRLNQPIKIVGSQKDLDKLDNAINQLRDSRETLEGAENKEKENDLG